MALGFHRNLGLGTTNLLLGILFLAASWAGSAWAQSPPLPTQGEPPPDFTLLNPAGKQVHLSDFKGKVIILTFWSCFTDTCFSTVGALDELLAQAAPSDLVAPTICSEIPPALAAQGYTGLLERCSAGQKILIDEKRAVTERYQIREFPTTVLIGRDFTIRDLLIGVQPLRDPALRARIKALVEERTPPASKPGPSPEP